MQLDTNTNTDTNTDTNSLFNALNNTIWGHTDHCLPRSWFEVFKESMLARQLIEADCYASLNCSKQLLNVVNLHSVQ